MDKSVFRFVCIVMLTIAILFSLYAMCANAYASDDAPPLFTVGDSFSAKLITLGPKNFIISGGIVITISLKDGHVTIEPPDAPLDVASREFWRTLQKGFDDVKREMCQ